MQLELECLIAEFDLVDRGCLFNHAGWSSCRCSCSMQVYYRWLFEKTALDDTLNPVSYTHLTLPTN